MTSLRQVRQDRQLSMRELAAKAGVAVGTIQRVEAGKNVPMPETIRRICDALGVEPEEVEEFKE